MFVFHLVSRIFIPKFSLGEHGLTVICRRCFQPKLSRTARFSGFQRKTLNTKPFKLLFERWLNDVEMCFTNRCHTARASVITKKGNERQTKTCFQELLFTRKEQAQRSVLLHVSTKEDIPCALAKCEQFGSITNAYCYSGERNNYFVLLEFSNEIAVRDLFKSCQHQHISDSFPVFSRIIQFEKKSKTNVPKVNIEVQEDCKKGLSLKIGRNISEVIEDTYSNEKLTELDTKLRYFFSTLVKDSASRVFPHCDVFPFGSSVNGIGRRGCDLDAMIKLYPGKGNSGSEFIFLNKTCTGQKVMQQKVIHFLGDFFHSFLPGINSVQKILHARMPIMKMNHRILKMDCDVSVNNMSAIFMSDVVHFCGEVDPRFRPLLYTIKKWAKEAEITRDRPGTWITNFGLTTLLIYFFQMERILPSLKDALVIEGEDNSPDFHFQYLKSVEEWKCLASQNVKSSARLLVEFLAFLAEHPFDGSILSPMGGEARPHAQPVALWVQYPFDEGLNVTKNVSEHELSRLRNKAAIAVESLDKRLDQNTHSVKDFSLLFGIAHSKRPKKAVDVNAYFGDQNNPKQKLAKYRRT